jgi:hypothetical protein
MLKGIQISTLAVTLALAGGCQESAGKVAATWQTDFVARVTDLESAGRNQYFLLEPGYSLEYGNGSETLVITVLNATKVVDGVVTRIVEERETKGSQPIEVSQNYFAIDKTNKNVYYFGEDVDMYKNGAIASHEGSWHAGGTYRFGMMMPGVPKVGQMFYQEMAPRVAMDRAEIVSVSETVPTPAGTFHSCVHTKETSAIEKVTGSKWYAPGIGLVKDGDMVLTKITAAR